MAFHCFVYSLMLGNVRLLGYLPEAKVNLWRKIISNKASDSCTMFNIYSQYETIDNLIFKKSRTDQKPQKNKRQNTIDLWWSHLMKVLWTLE